jgi:hypothetical protein
MQLHCRFAIARLLLSGEFIFDGDEAQGNTLFGVFPA